MVEIVPYTASDAEDLYQLFHDWDRSATYDKQLFHETLGLLEITRSRLFLAKVTEKLVGYIQLAPGLQIGREPYLEVVQLLVAEGHRSRAHVFYEARGFQLEKVSKFYQKTLD